MKFIATREQLLKPLQQISNILNGRQKLPILGNILLKVTKDELLLIGTDLEIEIVIRVVLSFSQAYEKGENTVSARKFFDICRKLPKGVEITVQLEGNRMSVYSGCSRFSLASLPAKDFPNLKEWHSEIEFTTPQLIMKRLIEMTYFSMGNQDIRYYLNGMLLETGDKKLRVVATDGHRLATCNIPINNSLPNRSIIVPRKGIIELMRILECNDMPLCIQIGSNNISAKVNNFIFTTKLLEGRFPDYRLVLPKNPDKILEIGCDTLKQALVRTAILSSEKFRGARLYLSENQIKITANNQDQEEAEEILNIIDAVYIGDEIEIGFNVNYVLDVLNVLKCKKVRILLTNPTSSLQIVDAATPQSAIYIIMPMRL